MNKKSSKFTTSNFNHARSKGAPICGQKPDQILSSTLSSLSGSSTEMRCNLSNIGKPGAEKHSESGKKVEKEVVGKLKRSTLLDDTQVAYMSYVSGLYLIHVQKGAREKAKTEWQICFRNLQAEEILLKEAYETYKRNLKEACALAGSESQIEVPEKIFIEVSDDMYQLLDMLKTVNQIMKIANSPIPLTLLRVTDASKGEFVSIMHKISNICNEIISIMKPCEESHKNVANILHFATTRVTQIRALLKESRADLPVIASGILRVLSLQLCLTNKDQSLN